jgi:hypothetical protein
MGLRVADGGESEGRPVIGRIEVKLTSDITSRESGQTSTWSFLTRESDQPIQEAKADDS